MLNPGPGQTLFLNPGPGHLSHLGRGWNRGFLLWINTKHKDTQRDSTDTTKILQNILQDIPPHQGQTGINKHIHTYLTQNAPELIAKNKVLDAPPPAISSTETQLSSLQAGKSTPSQIPLRGPHLITEIHALYKTNRHKHLSILPGSSSHNHARHARLPFLASTQTPAFGDGILAHAAGEAPVKGSLGPATTTTTTTTTTVDKNTRQTQ